jgi:TIR domain
LNLTIIDLCILDVRQLSYAREDAERMQTLFHFLTHNNVLVYCDQHIPDDPDWTRIVKPLVQNAASLIVMVTSNTENADGVNNEIYAMIDVGKKDQIIPVMVADGDKNAIPLRIANNNRINLRNNDWERQFEKLVNSIRFWGA